MRTLSIVLLFALTATANAVPVRWDIVDIAGLSGSFIYDADIGEFGEYRDSTVNYTGVFFDFEGELAADGVPAIVPLNLDFSFRTPFAGFRGFRGTFFEAVDPNLGRTFTLNLEYLLPGLTNAGGLVELASINSPSKLRICDPLEGCDGIDDIDITRWNSGTLYGTVVPIPAAVWLFASALLGLSSVSWLRRKQV